MRMGRKLLAALICLAVLAAGCGLAALAEVEAVSYIDHSWNETTSTLTDVAGSVTDYTVLTGGETSLSAGWYVARDELTYTGRLTLSGDVCLILEDGCELTAEQGITVSAGSSLAIYAQSEGENMGALEADGYNYNAAIGGLDRKDGGTVEIHGGGIRVTTHSGGVGIGGGFNGTGTVRVYGGAVEATAEAGAGIGGGFSGAGTVTVYGGEVKATADGGAGIGGGYSGAGTVTVYGGHVEASTENYSAAIGGGDDGAGEVTVYGGYVKASAEGYGAAIGSGCNGDGTVTVNGGYVEASAEGYGAAIGSGDDGAGTVTVNGGQVYANHTSDPGSAVRAHVVTLGWTEAADLVCASGYTAVYDEQSGEGGRLTLAKSFRSADSGTQYEAGDRVGEVFAGQLLIPDTDEAAALHVWPAKAAFTLPADLTQVGANAFQGISAGTVLVPAGVTKVGANAFGGNGLQKIRFLGSGTSVDAAAFDGCENPVAAYAIPGTDTWMSLSAIPGVVLLPIK